MFYPQFLWSYMTEGQTLSMQLQRSTCQMMEDMIMYHTADVGNA